MAFSLKNKIERFFKSLALKLGYNVSPANLLYNERFVEYPWVFRRIQAMSCTILDIGCYYGDFSIKLASQGYEVYGIDTQKYKKKHPNFNFIQCDVRWLPFLSNIFPVVIAVSTIEHIGVGYYGDFNDSEGDKKALKEILRVLRDSGKILITLPYGKGCITSMHRVYNDSALRRLIRDLDVKVEEEYFIKHKLTWVKSFQPEAESIDSSHEVRAVVCLNLSKSNLKS